MKKTLLFLGLVLLVFACTENKEIEKTKIKVNDLFVQQVNLRVEQIHSWLNAMPGSGTKFNISGKVSILPSTKYDFETLELKNILVEQNGQQIYLINPTVEVLNKTESEKQIAFSTIKGLGITPGLNTDKDVAIKLLFFDGSDEFAYEVDNVKIEKIY